MGVLKFFLEYLEERQFRSELECNLRDESTEWEVEWNIGMHNGYRTTVQGGVVHLQTKPSDYKLSSWTVQEAYDMTVQLNDGTFKHYEDRRVKKLYHEVNNAMNQ